MIDLVIISVLASSLALAIVGLAYCIVCMFFGNDM